MLAKLGIARLYVARSAKLTWMAIPTSSCGRFSEEEMDVLLTYNEARAAALHILSHALGVISHQQQRYTSCARCDLATSVALVVCLTAMCCCWRCEWRDREVCPAATARYLASDHHALQRCRALPVQYAACMLSAH